MFELAAFIPVIAFFGMAALGLFALLMMMFRIRARDLRHLGSAAEDEPLMVSLRPVLERLAYLATLIPQEGHRRWARRTLRQGGLIQQWSPELLQTVKLAIAMVAFFGSLLFFIVLGMSISWLMVIGGTIVAYYVPDAAVWQRANERQENIRKSLPFVIDLIAVSAEAGLAFQQAIRNVVKNSAGKSGVRDPNDSAGELLREFEMCLDSLQMGRSMDEALRETAERISLEEFFTFVGAVSQAERLGTPVSEALKQQSEELRVKLASRVEAKAAQAPVKILFPLMIFIFPVTAWVIVGPILIRAFSGAF